MTQRENLLSYFKKHKSLTQLQAFTALGICRLSERIRELEADGYLFSRTRERVPSRYGSATVTRYFFLRRA